MKGINETIVTAVLGAILSLLGLTVMTGTVDALVGGQSTAQSTSEMVELADAINNTCKQEGISRKQVNLVLQSGEELKVNPNKGKKVVLVSNEGQHESNVMSACGEDFSIQSKTIEYGGIHHTVQENGRITVERGQGIEDGGS